MATLPSRKIIKVIEKDGWVQVRTKGSHRQFRHPDKPGTVTVPHPKKDVPQDTVRSIEKQAGISLFD